MRILGADIPALFSFGDQLRERRRNIEQATQRLQALILEANWVGPDRDQFVAEWNEVHAPSLRSVCENIGNAAKRVVDAAIKQQNASAE